MSYTSGEGKGIKLRKGILRSLVAFCRGGTGKLELRKFHGEKGKAGRARAERSRGS